MYGTVVKTGFCVWRLGFMSPHFRVGRHIVLIYFNCLSAIHRQKQLLLMTTILFRNLRLPI